jgi:hypothetical protein
MVGQTVEARAPFSPAIAIYIVIAIGLGVLGVAIESWHPLFMAALPLGLAFGLFMGRPRRAILLVDNDGLRVFEAHEKVYFRYVTSISVGGREYGPNALSLPAKPLEIDYVGGTLVVPPVMNVDFTAFHNFLVSQVPSQPPRTIPAVLADYLNDQLAKFGSDKVVAVHTRRVFAEVWRRRRRKWLCGGIFLAAAAWFVGAIVFLSTLRHAEDYVLWLTLGIFIGLAGLIGFFSPRAMARNAIGQLLAKNPNSCIIVGPAGLAMVQGDTKGALPWREITKVTRNVSNGLQRRRGHGLRVQVRGAEIIVFDIYEASPEEIEALLRRNLELPFA